MTQTFQKNNLLLCLKQKQQEYNHLCDKMGAEHINNTITYYMNIIQNEYHTKRIPMNKSAGFNVS